MNLYTDFQTSTCQFVDVCLEMPNIWIELSDNGPWVFESDIVENEMGIVKNVKNFRMDGCSTIASFEKDNRELNLRSNSGLWHLIPVDQSRRNVLGPDSRR